MSYAYSVDSQTPFNTHGIFLRPGETKEVFIKLKNTGTTAWQKGGPNPVRLGTANPHDRGSAMYKSGNLGWLSSSRIEFEEAGPIATNQFATFRFEVTCPEGSLQLKEYFTPVVEGIQWMTPDPHISILFDCRAICTYLFTWYTNSDPAVREGHHWEGLTGSVKTTDIPKIGNGTTVEDGFYNSLDENVIRRQLDLMSDAGITCVLLDYAGHADITETATGKIMTIMEADYPNMRFAIFMDNMKDWTQTQFNVIAHYATSNRYQKYDNKPLLLCFGQAGGSDNQNRFFFAATSANDTTSGWVYWLFESWTTSSVINGGGTVTARYDDGPVGQGPFPRTNTQAYDQNYANNLFQANLNTVSTAWHSSTPNTLRIVFFPTWNEYHERISGYEPHEDRNLNGATSPAVSDTYAYDKMKTAITNLTA